MKNLLLGVLFLLCTNLGFSQVVRFNIDEEYVGIQTPHEWNVYASLDTRIFSHPFINDYNVNVFKTQLGYNWYTAKRGNVRSAMEHTFWFVSPNEDDDYNGYWGIIPIAFNMYPFSKDYIGLDLWTRIDPYNMTIKPGFGVLIRLN